MKKYMLVFSLVVAVASPFVIAGVVSAQSRPPVQNEVYRIEDDSETIVVTQASLNAPLIARVITDQGQRDVDPEKLGAVLLKARGFQKIDERQALIDAVNADGSISQVTRDVLLFLLEE